MAPIAAHRYDGRVVVVTGAAQGIGRACALCMAAEGARVVLVDRAAGPCEAVRDQITAEGGEALLVATDLEQHEGAQAVVQAALQAHGRVDVSVHNVGGTIWVRLARCHRQRPAHRAAQPAAAERGRDRLDESHLHPVAARHADEPPGHTRRDRRGPEAAAQTTSRSSSRLTSAASRSR